MSEERDLLRAVARSRAAARGDCPDEERILAFYRGALDAAGEEAMREHLALCERCRTLAGEARSFLRAMGEEPIGAPPSQRRFWLAAAAAVVVALLAGWVWWMSTARQPWREYARTAAAYPLAGAPDGDVVFRGADAGQVLSDDMAPYLAGDYAETERRLAERLRGSPDDLTAHFYRGVSLLLLRRPEEAIPPLARATADGESVLGREARWYLALSRLESGAAQAAREDLKGLAGADGPRRGEARELLRRLGSR